MKNIKTLVFIIGIATLMITIGFVIAVFVLPEGKDIDFNKALVPEYELNETLAKGDESIKSLSNSLNVLQESILKEEEKHREQIAKLEELAKKSKNNKNLSDYVYENMIVSRLGDPVETVSGKNSSFMIFKLEKADLRGYMVKIKLKTKNALKVTVNPSDKPKGETTLEAAKRTGAILAINGGGFATGTMDGEKRLMPMGTTMIDGKLYGNFVPSEKDLAFAGFTKDGKLTGGKYKTEEELKASKAYQGVTFVPALVSDWEPLTIPSKWAKSKQPRTVLGQYPNGDIFFIVVDGRQSNWSKGITLEEMQILLLELGVMEAFNLDGGGSSAIVYNGKLLNKPSDGHQRKIATNFVIMK